MPSAESQAQPEPGAALQSKILDRSARIGIVGMGYVGLPLALEFAGAGFTVTGFEVDPRRIESLEAGQSYITDVLSSELADLRARGLFRATSSYAKAAELDCLIICVPTPLRKTREPDTSYIVGAMESLAPSLRPQQVLVLESTTYPGTTEEILLPVVQGRGLQVGRDFFLGFSPERVDPGNPTMRTRDIPKVVGGVTAACTAMAVLMYGQIIRQVVGVANPRVAEMAKLWENTFRSVNIALANEMALLCRRLGLETGDVIAAAATKPFGFMPFYPGPGIGGHCIPVDPVYLSWKARLNGFEPRFITLADDINRQMPRHVVALVSDILNEQGRGLKGSEIHVWGVAYKRGVNDVRESPALEVIAMLKKKGARVTYSDPYVPRITLDGQEWQSLPPKDERCKAADCVVILTDHVEFDYAWLCAHARAVVDTRSATRAVAGAAPIVRL
jgi:UDP-N-acetyl-D-glucosamine dehydrogenase